MRSLFLFTVLLLVPFGAFSAETNLKEEPFTANAQWIHDYINPAPDFPKPGILFQWYGPLMKEPAAFARTIESFAERYEDKEIHAILGIESRGFIFGAALAYRLKVPFILVRKPGKLPGELISIDYELEYGTDSLEMEANALSKGAKVLIIDDVVATGGTALAAAQLVEKVGAHVVEVACLIELPLLNARKKLSYPVYSLLAVDVE